MEGNTVPINYLSRSPAAKLKLIQGDSDAFSDVLGLINEYEGESTSFATGHISVDTNRKLKLTRRDRCIKKT